MKRSVVILVALCAIARAGEQHAWVKTIPDAATWHAFSKTVASDELGKCISDLKTVTNDEIYKAAEFQAFTKGRAVGKLHVVPIGTPYESLTFDRHEIALLQESYPDITPVAGIIATQFSTPLSHVNLRAGAWG